MCYGGSAVAETLFDLPPVERVVRFRELAKEARSLAASNQHLDVHADYTRIAATWERMANELEAQIEPEK